MPVEDSTKADLIAAGLEKCIHEIRRHNVMLDHDLADLYGVDVRALNQAVVRNSSISNGLHVPAHARGS